ncbi:hypothetical protein HPB48_010082 [Haemaphysalis longicornis]|uniref:Uncharacterized protein n=1 Tax=Haemaphysalis longicornis TaxID=44386 RepID=A0A9J6GAF7_HAELO|nr:hypothetical protein HPB48_010082 [Haemaphysalis longicornis]
MTLFGVEYPCSLYRKTIPVCDVCHEVAHQATACPQPNVNAYHRCGLRDLQARHTCKYNCTPCGRSHLTAAKGCPKRFRVPFLLKRRESAKRRLEELTSMDDLDPQHGRRDRCSIHF